MKSVISVEVAASPDLLFRLAHDVERWPSLLPHYVSVRVERRADGGAALARFVAVRTLVPWVWRIGPLAPIVDRLFVRPIAGRTLATLKSIAEATSAVS